MTGKKRAFTLIELLVVVSIIAVLLSILVPSLSKVKSKARKLICQTHMHDLGLTFELYRAANDGFFPTAFWGTDSFNRRIYVESLIKEGNIEGKETVLGNDEWVAYGSAATEAYSCPSFRKFIRAKGELVFSWDPATVSEIREYYPIGYGYNGHLSRYNYWDAATGKPAASSDWSFVGRNPSGRVMSLVDSTSFFQFNNSGSKFYPVYQLGSTRQVSNNGTIAGLHSGGFSNSLWADMHVETRKADEFFKRDSSDPTKLVGRSVLDGQSMQGGDWGYSYSDPKGKIACGE